MKRPNVLILYTDQQRWDAVGYANPLVKTPNIDALAAAGATFENTFVNTPVCMPSRMSMLSGRYPATLGIACNGIPMPMDIPCLHNILKLYGYKTANIGKLHFQNHSDHDHRTPHPSYGFDVMINSDEPGCYDDAYIKWVERKAPDMVGKCRVSTPPAWEGTAYDVHPRNTDEPYLFEGDQNLTHTAFVGDETATFIENSGNEPFFCIAGFYAPHCPLNPPERFVDMYNEADMPLPVRNEGDNFNDHSDSHWQKVKAYYYAMISQVDEEVGRILSALEESGKLDDTLIIFTSDHGEYLGDYGRVQKGGPEDSSSHVPLLFKGQGIGNGKYGEMTEAIDIAPTILDYCGVQVPPFMQGQSLMPLFKGQEFKARNSALIELKHPFESAYKAVRTEEFLYMAEADNEELYDLRENPYALKNVAGETEYSQTLSEMRKEMISKLIETQSQYPLKEASY